MNRLTRRTTNCPLPVLVRDRAFGPAYFISEEDYTDYRDALEKLAAYEDTGLEPEEVESAKKIAARLALADYPHNFQGERSDIASYMRWITSVLKEAKEWWKNLLEAREDAEKALEGMEDDER